MINSFSFTLSSSDEGDPSTPGGFKGGEDTSFLAGGGEGDPEVELSGGAVMDPGGGGVTPSRLSSLLRFSPPDTTGRAGAGAAGE